MNHASKKLKITIILTAIFFLLILIFSIIGITINSKKTATLEVTVAPSSSLIKINDQTYQNGTYQLEPGVYSVEISKEGFTPYSSEITLTAGETTKLEKYLLEEDGGVNWYLDHESDMMIMNSIGDHESDTKAKNYKNKDPVFSITPYYDETNNHFSIIATDKENAYEKITITISTNACVEPLISDYVDEAESYLKKQGITLEDYNITTKSLCNQK